MGSLTISNITVRQDAEGRYCLNDLHKAAGAERRHQPAKWLITQQSRELIAEIEKTGILVIQAKQGIGTFVGKELVYAYAMWISPIFHLQVIRAYDQLVTPPSTARDPIELLNDPAAMRRLLLSYCEKVLDLEETAKRLAPKAIALDRIAEAHGSFCLTDTAKSLQLRPKDLLQWLLEHRWIYRRPGGSGYLAYQQKIQAGLVTMKILSVERSDGTARIVEQVRVTAKGLARLGELVPTKNPCLWPEAVPSEFRDCGDEYPDGERDERKPP
jgi:phage antirepressor YoqD-like protein